MAKILIVRLGAMGDILHALPTVTTIRAALPDATLGLAVGGLRLARELVEGERRRRHGQVLDRVDESAVGAQ